MTASNLWKWQTVVIHLSLWMVYVLLEWLSNLPHIAPDEKIHLFWLSLRNLPVIIVPTYFMALWAVPRYLEKEKLSTFVLVVVLVAGFVFFARIKWTELMNFLVSSEYYRIPATKLLKSIIRDYSIIALAVSLYIIGDWKKKSRMNESLIKAKADVEIKLLKGQLQPHFLFNSLNNIYSLALTKSDLTAQSILKLTELLDYLVYQVNLEKISIGAEINLIKNYIELEKLRYGKKLKVTDIIELNNESFQIRPLLLLPFVENCFKHGGPDTDGTFYVDIHIIQDEQKLTFEISNSLKKSGETSSKGGIGLDNIRKRLKLSYPGLHTLSIDESGGRFRVSLKILTGE